jgi:hypothetical protein
VVVAAAGLVTTLAALSVAFSWIDFGLPSLSELVVACQRYALPIVRPVSVLVFAIGSVGLAAMFLTGGPSCASCSPAGGSSATCGGSGCSRARSARR